MPSKMPLSCDPSLSGDKLQFLADATWQEIYNKDLFGELVAGV